MSRGFLIGGGPSIERYINEGFDFSLLDKELTVGANKAYLVCKLDYMVFIDSWFCRQFLHEINEQEGYVLYPRFSPKPDIKKRSKRFEHRKVNEDLPKDFDRISIQNNAGVTALRALYLTGANPIYLVGIDLNSTGKSNFHLDYEEYQNRKTTKKKSASFLRKFVDVIEAMRKEGRIVYSTTRGSPLNSYVEYVDLRDVVG